MTKGLAKAIAQAGEWTGGNRMLHRSAEALLAEPEDPATSFQHVRAQLRQVIVGQEALLDRLLIGLLANGHVLIEGVPGTGKTLAVTTLALTLEAICQRIQFTPDLLP